MNLVFDRTTLEILKAMGYRYFCNKVVSPPELDPNEGLAIYWELIPFKAKSSALKTYLQLKEVDANNYIWYEDENLAEIADGIFGLEFHIKITDNVFS